MNRIDKYINAVSNQGKKLQLDTTYNTIKQIDRIVNYYLSNDEASHDAVLIDIYGLLQSLFVGIDALYSLTIGVTKNKFYININQNQTLNGLKHIRNDIVGHPTNRRYGENGIGYSIIKDDFTYHMFKYETYVFIGEHFEIKETDVDLVNLSNEYLKEKDIILKRLEEYLSDGYVGVNLEKEILQLYNFPSIINLDSIVKKFIDNYGNLGNHRFIWRTDLIRLILNFKNNDKEILDFFNYVLKIQILKLLEISNEMVQKSFRMPRFKLPYLMKKFFKYLNKNEGLADYLSNLHDYFHPYFKSDLEYLLKVVKDKSALKLLNLLNETKDPNKVYLIGSTIKKYKKKNNNVL